MKTVLYLAMSLNGMIAGENDEAPWSTPIWEAYVKTVERFGNIIVGHNTHRVMKKSGDFDSFMAKPLCVVLTNKLLEDRDAVPVSSPAQAIEHIRQKGFSKALVGGGSKAATSFLQAKLIDEIEIDIEPILIGRGVNLTQEVDLVAKLALKEVKQLDEGVVHLVYSVERDST
jgi:dihydrofolate reductase